MAYKGGPPTFFLLTWMAPLLLLFEAATDNSLNSSKYQTIISKESQIQVGDPPKKPKNALFAVVHGQHLPIILGPSYLLCCTDPIKCTVLITKG